MIGVISPRSSSFKNPLEYLELGRDRMQRGRAAWMEFHNLATRNPKLAACFMAATAAGSVSGTEKPVYHLSVSFDIDDPVDGATMRRVAERTRRDMGLLDYQCVVVAHQDRSHPHLHFLVNLVHPERRTLWRDWRDYHRLERSLRAQEVELGLRIVPGWNAPVPSLARGRDGLEAQPQNARWVRPRPGPRRGDKAFLRDMIVRAAPVLQRADSWADIERGLAEEGLTLRSRGGGFIITDGKHLVKASQVGRGCSRYRLEKRLGRWPDYRARMAAAAMARPGPAVQPEPAVRQLETSAPAVDSLASTLQQDASTPVVPPVHEYNLQAHARGGRRPQFGDAGRGIADLFGHAPAKREVQAAPVLDHGSIDPAPQLAVPAQLALSIAPVEPPLPIAPTRPRRRVDLVKDVKDRAAPVLASADSWAELEHGLAERGLSLRASGGGFVVTDGETEVKASKVGRPFSRLNLEKRFGEWLGPSRRDDVAATPRTEPAVQAEPGARQPEVRAVDPAPSTPRQKGPTETGPTTLAPAPTHELRELQAEATQPRTRGFRRPQFGDAGYGIADLFGHAPAKREMQQAPVLDHTAAEQQPRPVEVQADHVFTMSAPQVEPTVHPARQERHAPTIEPTTAAELVGVVDSIASIQPEPIAPPALTAPVEDMAAPEASRAAPPPTIQPRALEEAHAPVSSEQAAKPEPSVQPPAPHERREAATPAAQRPEIENRVVPGTEGLGDQLLVAGATAPVQREALAAADAPEVAGVPERRSSVSTPRDVVPAPPKQAIQPPQPRPAESSVPVQPLVMPEEASHDPVAKVGEPIRPIAPSARPVEPLAPVRERMRPATERERYRAVLQAFKAELRALYLRPRVAERAFMNDVVRSGREHAVRTLASAPEQYGKFWVLSKPERLSHAVRAADVYAQWQEGRTRPFARRLADLCREGAATVAAQDALSIARAAADQAVRDSKALAERASRADKAELKIPELLHALYAEPERAREKIDALRSTPEGRTEMERLIRDEPERFGDLFAVKRPWYVNLVREPDISGARLRAPSAATEIAYWYAALEARPKPEDLERAAQAKRETAAAEAAALQAREARPHKSQATYVEEVARMIRHAGRGSAGARLGKQLESMLSGGALQIAREAQEAASISDSTLGPVLHGLRNRNRGRSGGGGIER